MLAVANSNPRAPDAGAAGSIPAACVWKTDGAARGSSKRYPPPTPAPKADAPLDCNGREARLIPALRRKSPAGDSGAECPSFNWRSLTQMRVQQSLDRLFLHYDRRQSSGNDCCAAYVQPIGAATGRASEVRDPHARFRSVPASDGCAIARLSRTSAGSGNVCRNLSRSVSDHARLCQIRRHACCCFDHANS